jgi:hypothetical protein
MRVKLGKSRLRIWAVLLACFAVAACMGPLGEVLAKQEAERQSLAQQTAARLVAGHSCCASYREMHFSPLAFGQEREIVLSETSPIFSFPFGKTRFDAIELPPLKVDDTLSIRAVELISGPDAKPIFRPTLVLLDDAFRPIDPSPALSLKEHFSGWSIEGHEETIAIGKDYARARFVIVAADPAYSGQDYVRGAHTNTIPAGGNIYVATSSPKKLYPYGFEGRAFIALAHHSG